MNSVEKRAAIETGQEVDRVDIDLRGGLAAQAAALQKAFTLDGLEVIEVRIEAAQNGGSPKQLEALAVVPDVKPVHDKTHTQDRNGVAAADAVDQANEGKPARPGDGRTGHGTLRIAAAEAEQARKAEKVVDPLAQLAEKQDLKAAGAAAQDQPERGAAHDGVVPSVPKAPSWRD